MRGVLRVSAILLVGFCLGVSNRVVGVGMV